MTPKTHAEKEADVQAALESMKGHEAVVKDGASKTVGQIVPILHIDIKPTNVDPGTPSGVGNMKRVLSAILNDEKNKITVKDEVGNPVGVRNFNEIYPQVIGPKKD